MKAQKLEEVTDAVVLNSIPAGERRIIANFRESYSLFREAWKDYLEKSGGYRKNKL